MWEPTIQHDLIVIFSNTEVCNKYVQLIHIYHLCSTVFQIIDLSVMFVKVLCEFLILSKVTSTNTVCSTIHVHVEKPNFGVAEYTYSQIFRSAETSVSYCFFCDWNSQKKLVKMVILLYGFHLIKMNFVLQCTIWIFNKETCLCNMFISLVLKLHIMHGYKQIVAHW